MPKIYEMTVICNRCNWINHVVIEVFKDGSVIFNEICHNTKCNAKIIYSSYKKVIK